MATVAQMAERKAEEAKRPWWRKWWRAWAWLAWWPFPGHRRLMDAGDRDERKEDSGE